MSNNEPSPEQPHSNHIFVRGLTPIHIAIVVGLPALLVRFDVISFRSHPLQAILFGLGIVGAAFLLSWAAEVAELDISRGLAIAVLAFIAVLPEYAVDLVFATKGGHAYAKYGEACQSAAAKLAGDDSPCSLALANMTGANRMLIGIGWSLVVFVSYFAWKRRGQIRKSVDLGRSHSVEVGYLALAALYSITIPIRHFIQGDEVSRITLFDAAVLIAIFVAYTIRVSRAEAEEPELVGPAAIIGTFPVRKRRLTVVLLFIYAGAVILACAEPFAEALVHTGEDLGISTFFLVQWVAPLASEAPELLIAGLFAWRLRADAGLSTLVSSKVNQWTLLVGTLPIAFGIAANSFHGLPIYDQQADELFLTSAQTIFAVAVLTNLSLSVKEAFGLLGLFFAQFLLAAVLPESLASGERHIVSAIYLVTAAILLLRQRGTFGRLLVDGFRTPYKELSQPR